ncbi:hypothetical protein PHLCEN_2v6483 [Hermanssonia centrifuga]|uniref:Uncharacterized protein n=1 Tax=Hermanssonia centrifuga TaxID=98765 RepID=A0A2R6NZ97_9APHY|nr:hypothetical protein PHLCEN_2v6483 [Hermanssonia centrifuga]
MSPIIYPCRSQLIIEQSQHTLPPLLPIIKLLSSPVGSGSLFDITGNSDKADYYDELGCHVDILNLALNDVDAYVVEEKSKEENLQVSRPSSPTKAKSQETELQQIKSFLQELHGKIGTSNPFIRPSFFH